MAKAILTTEQQLTASNDQVDQLTKEVEEKDNEIASLKEEIASLGNVVTEKKQPKAEKKTPVIPDPVDVDGTTVKFNFPCFRFGGNRYEAEDAATDQELMRKILATKGQGILKIMA